MFGVEKCKPEAKMQDGSPRNQQRAGAREKALQQHDSLGGRCSATYTSGIGGDIHTAVVHDDDREQRQTGRGIDDGDDGDHDQVEQNTRATTIHTRLRVHDAIWKTRSCTMS
jgi:hypothetical protein